MLKSPTINVWHLIFGFINISFTNVIALVFFHRCSELRCLLVDFSFDDCKMSFSISFDKFLLRVLFLVSICLENIYLVLSFEVLCIYVAVICYLVYRRMMDSVYRSSLLVFIFLNWGIVTIDFKRYE